MLVCNCLFKIRILSVCNNITKLARQHSPVIEVGMVMQANVLKYHFNFLNHNNKNNNKKSSKQKSLTESSRPRLTGKDSMPPELFCLVFVL